jgi:hypothetical protein
MATATSTVIARKAAAWPVRAPQIINNQLVQLVEELGKAGGVAFAEGSALAHACCIARERGFIWRPAQ